MVVLKPVPDGRILGLIEYIVCFDESRYDCLPGGFHRIPLEQARMSVSLMGASVLNTESAPPGSPDVKPMGDRIPLYQ